MRPSGISIFITGLNLCFVLGLATAQNTSGKRTEKGIASYYSDYFNGKITANGEVFSQSKFTAAHPSLPFNTSVRITNLTNNKKVIVRINDRGPFVDKRIIDLSKAAAKKLDYLYAGLTPVKIEILQSVTPTQVNTVENIQAIPSDSFSIKHTYTSEYRAPLNQPIEKAGNFGVQIGSFSSKEHWDTFAATFHKYHPEALKCQEVEIQHKIYYRAIAGSFKEKVTADSLKKNLIIDFKGCFVVYF